MDNGPVFVAGLGRTGKTLLCSLLAAHPEIAMPRQESNMWRYYYRQYGDLSRRDNFERCLAAMLPYEGVRILNPDPDRIREEFRQGEQTYARLFALFHAHYAEQLNKPRWGVQSVGIEYYNGPIFAAYPTVKMIHMIRDPRDRYEAVISQNLRALSRGHRKTAKVTAAWQYSLGLANGGLKRYPDRYKVVRYEAMVSRPEETLHEIYSFLGVENTSALHAAKSAPRYRGTDITTAFIGRFQQVMSKREIALIQSHARRDMIAHNYKLESVKLLWAENLMFHMIDQPIDLAMLVAWRIWKILQLRFPAQMGSRPRPHLLSPVNGEK